MEEVLIRPAERPGVHRLPPRIHVLWWKAVATLMILSMIAIASIGSMAYARQSTELSDLRKEVAELQQQLGNP